MSASTAAWPSVDAPFGRLLSPFDRLAGELLLLWLVAGALMLPALWVLWPASPSPAQAMPAARQAVAPPPSVHLPRLAAEPAGPILVASRP